MNRRLITPDRSSIPSEFHMLLENTPVYDSSSSRDARVLFLDREGGLFLKSAPAGSLACEAKMNAWFHSLGLGPEMLTYRTGELDWLLTRQVPGEDCIWQAHLEQPEKLCQVLADALLYLQSLETMRCPVQNRTEQYIADARRNYAQNRYDMDLFPDNWGYASPEEAWAVVENNANLLQQDTLMHGDFCLPNIMLKDWRLSGMIDLGRAGVGDKHIDLFWGAWTMQFNLKEEKWSRRFLDAYGRENFEPEMLRVIAAFEVFE